MCSVLYDVDLDTNLCSSKSFQDRIFGLIESNQDPKTAVVGDYIYKLKHVFFK